MNLKDFKGLLTNPQELMDSWNLGGDGKQRQRNRLFIRWFNNLYYFDTIRMTAEGVENFAAIIVQKSNPNIENIVNMFDDVVKALREKP